MAGNVVSFSFSRCSTGGPEAHSAGWWLYLLHFISIISGPQLIRAPSPFGLVWLYLPHLVYLLSNSNCNCHLTSVLTELYNRSPTRSLEWHDWSSSSGNNCHAVHRSLSSGALVYECIMGFTLSHFISQIHPRDLFRLLAIGMCHFLPVHHFVMPCLLGPKVKIQHYQWCLRDEIVKAMHCGIVVNVFELQSRCFVHFRTNTLWNGVNPLTLPAMG